MDTVFGTDGVMVCGLVADYAFARIDEACPIKDRKKLIGWLTANS